MSKVKIKKYFEIDGSEVRAKVACRVVLDLSEYKHISEDYGDVVGIEETSKIYKVPGFFKVELDSVNDSVDFFFPYSVYLNKTEDSTSTSKEIKINFDVGDVIFYARFKEAETDVKILNSLFENGAKYLANKPDKLVQSLWLQLKPSAEVPFHHLELIISQLYGVYDDQAGLYKPLRLTELPYNKDYVLNTKQSSHMMNNTMGFLYGYSNDALRTTVSRRNDPKNNFFEDILGGNYDKLIEDLEPKQKTKYLPKKIQRTSPLYFPVFIFQ